MNIKKVTNIMAKILICLLLLIVASVAYKNINNNEEIDNTKTPQKAPNGTYEEEGYVSGFGNFYIFFPSFEDGEECKNEILEIIKNYGSNINKWRVYDGKYDEIKKELFFILKSDDNVSDESYEIRVNGENTTVVRIN